MLPLILSVLMQAQAAQPAPPPPPALPESARLELAIAQRDYLALQAQVTTQLGKLQTKLLEAQKFCANAGMILDAVSVVCKPQEVGTENGFPKKIQ